MVLACSSTVNLRPKFYTLHFTLHRRDNLTPAAAATATGSDAKYVRSKSVDSGMMEGYWSETDMNPAAKGEVKDESE